MVDFLSLLKDTTAFKVFLRDKRADKLSHAYLIVHPDADNLTEYLKAFVKVALCACGEPCGECRACRLIDNGAHPDVKFYPTEKDAVLTEDVVDLISESYIKPLESARRVFVVNKAETMLAAAQNKLLKTLEEPPKNVVIIMGATSEYPLLSTVKSRVKKLVIPEFSNGVLLDALIEEYPDRERLITAIACGDGTVGKAVKNYGDEQLASLVDIAVSVITEMKTSKNVLRYSRDIANAKCSAKDFLAVLKSILRDMLMDAEGKPELIKNPTVNGRVKGAEGFTEGAIIYAINGVSDAEQRLKYNAAEESTVERALFDLLEGKYKWRK